MRCAIYARYSSDLQRESSVEDQIRKCRAFADPRGWTIEDSYVRGDHEMSGAALAGRSALESLLADAKRRQLLYSATMGEVAKALDPDGQPRPN
jgi:DNA invertase Pin-like site-specific DNA recombinase